MAPDRVFELIITGVLALLLLWELRSLLLAHASTRWKKTMGTVSSAAVTEESSYDEDGDGHVSHGVEVRYSYRVAGRSYQSRRLTYRPTWGLVFAKAVDLLRGIAPGREVVVYHHPRVHSRSVLVPGASLDNVFRIVLIATVLVLVVVKTG